jgi:hypothetical protein
MKSLSGAVLLGILLAMPPPLLAKVDDATAAKLGTSLTPIGAEKAGNATGTIPAWNGGLPPGSWKRGDNPYAADKPLYTVTTSNYRQYAAQLAEGYKALFQTYPDFVMKVYPSHRSAAYPQWFYDATRKNATTVELEDNGYGFCCAAQGYPFPVPANGTELMWNHIMRYNTKGYAGYVDAAETQADGSTVIERGYGQLTYVYNNPKTTLATLKNQNLYAMGKTLAPPNKAGTADLLHVPIDRIKEQTGVWEFVQALGRVRRIGEVGYDNPLFDGLMTHDQLDMFNGPLDRYSLKLLGKKEMLVPYNDYTLYSDKLKYKDIIRPGHINQELARYELHRMWVMEADLRPGYSHIYRKRLFYLDEDSWLVLAQDIYDDRDQFWRFSEAHTVTITKPQVVVNGLQIHYDLQSRRYVAVNLTNEESQEIEYDWEKDPSYFTPQELQKFATAGK